MKNKFPDLMELESWWLKTTKNLSWNVNKKYKSMMEGQKFIAI